MEITKAVAEISIRRVDDAWFTWSVFSPGLGCHAREGHGCSATEALYRAVDSVRADEARPNGQLAVYSLTGDRVALAPLWSVPPYALLPWAAAAA